MTIPRGFIPDYTVVSRNTAALIIFFESRHCVTLRGDLGEGL